MGKKDGVTLDAFEVIADTDRGKIPVSCYARFGPLVVANLGRGMRLYTLTHEASGMRCGPIFSDGILACEAARHILKELGAEYFSPDTKTGANKGQRVQELCQPFLDQEASFEKESYA